MKRILVVFTLATVSLWAGPQDIQFPANFDKLAGKAKEVVDITLDADMLGLAGNFLSEGSADEKTAKDLVKSFKGIYIRSFEFEEEGQYSNADLDDVRAQLKAPDWVRIVNVQEKKKGGESAQIYLKKENGKVAGITILAAEPKELTVVHIVGPIKPEDIAKLSGKFGIPNMAMGPGEDAEKVQ